MSNENSFFPAQRHAVILDLLKKRGAISIQELVSEISVSSATIRRDLDYLSDRDYIERTHGGVVLVPPNRTAFEPDHAIGSQVARKEKIAIGKLAAGRLKKGQSVIFDSSSTVLEAARAVVNYDFNLTAVTNDLSIAIALSSGHIRLMVPGGTVREGSFTLIGEPGVQFISELNVDIALVGIHALVDGVLSDASIEIAKIKRQMIDAAKHVILLVDSSKFQSPAFCKVCSVTRVNEIITDNHASEAWRTHMRDFDITVSFAEIEAA